MEGTSGGAEGGDIRARVNDLIMDAAASTVGHALASTVFGMRKEAVRASKKQAGGGCDLECHAPVTLFRRLEALARASETATEAPRSVGGRGGEGEREEDGARGDASSNGDVDASSNGDVGGAGRERHTAPGIVTVRWYYADGSGGGEEWDEEWDEDSRVCGRRQRGAVAGVEVVSVSEYGVERRRRYASPASLADAVVEAIDPHALGGLVADIRVEEEEEAGGGATTMDRAPPTPGAEASPSSSATGKGGGVDCDRGFGGGDAEAARKTFEKKPKGGDRSRGMGGGGVILIMSKRHLLVNGARGMLLCRACGWMFKGDKGLREHQQVKHRQSYETSKAAVAESRKALVALTPHGGRVAPPPGRDGHGDVYGGSYASGTAPRRHLANRDTLDGRLIAARDGDVDSLRAVVAGEGVDGWDPRRVSDVLDTHGSSALHWAAGSGRLDTCRFLVEECGMDPNLEQKKDGRTAMHWAARNGQTDVCEWLWATHGVSVDKPTRDGTTPFHWAVWQGHLETCRWLADVARADWSTLNSFGCNAAQWAAQAGNVAMCEYLLTLGLDLKLLNNNGHSALHKAAVKGRQNVCEWLVNVAGLDETHMGPDGDGNTPAEMARLEGHTALSEWLERALSDTRRSASRSQVELKGEVGSSSPPVH